MPAIGYFGIIVPEYDFWQGYYLIDDVAEQAKHWMDEIRAVIGGFYTPASITMSPVPDISEDDQPWIGITCAAMTEFALASEHSKVGLVSYALHTLTGYKHFLITATPEKSGIMTKIESLPVNSAEGVRLAINRHPLVLRAKQNMIRKAKVESRTKH
jgi:hypothetical protein